MGDKITVDDGALFEVRESAPSRDKPVDDDSYVNLPLRDFYSQHIADTSDLPNLKQAQIKKSSE